MERQKIEWTRYYSEVMRAQTSRGLLLCAYDNKGKANAMTMGWATLGSIWGIPIWSVLVRPSRYTYQCIESSGCFTVNVPGADLNAAALFCGTKSGRDVDKFAECNLTAEQASTVQAPTIAQCPIVYECELVHSNDVISDRLDEKILAEAYAEGDLHRFYYGRILGAFAAPDAAERLV